MPTDNPEPAHLLAEGVDYTVEAGRYVFTADYLSRRGYCCENGCRHCPYRAEKEKDSGRRDSNPHEV